MEFDSTHPTLNILLLSFVFGSQVRFCYTTYLVKDNLLYALVRANKNITLNGPEETPGRAKRRCN